MGQGNETALGRLSSYSGLAMRAVGIEDSFVNRITPEPATKSDCTGDHSKLSSYLSDSRRCDSTAAAIARNRMKVKWRSVS